MDLEATSLQPNVKGVLLSNLRKSKSDLNNLKGEVKRLTLGNMATREELLESVILTIVLLIAIAAKCCYMYSCPFSANGVVVPPFLQTTERLSTDRIKNSRRTKLETEELGIYILQDVHQQRILLLHANNTVHGVYENISKSKRMLTAMSRRMDRNKWIIGLIIAVLVVAIVVILYFKLK